MRRRAEETGPRQELHLGGATLLMKSQPQFLKPKASRLEGRPDHPRKNIGRFSTRISSEAARTLLERAPLTPAGFPEVSLRPSGSSQSGLTTISRDVSKSQCTL